jgi:hypothetical protein
MEKVARVEATRMSQGNVRVSPAPMHAPLIAQMIGFADRT